MKSKYNSLGLIFTIGLFAACATSSGLLKSDMVTLVLNDGTKVKAQVLDISRSYVTFKAKSVKQAYELGEVLPRGRISGVQLADGQVTTLDQYVDQQRSAKSLASAAPASAPSPRKSPVQKEITLEQQYAELKSKPVSEMSENEFKFFMTMMEKEQQADTEKRQQREQAILALQQKAATAAPEPTLPRLPAQAVPASPVASVGLEDVVGSMIDAGLAADYIAALEKKSASGQKLSAAESEMLDKIRSNPRWQNRMEEIVALRKSAEQAMSRVYLFNPEALETSLGLRFNADSEMDFMELTQQLHRSMGPDVRISDYRKLVDVFGEAGGQTMKKLLERYSDLQLVTKANSIIATK